MSEMYLVYFLLGMLMFFGAKACARGMWNEDFTSLKQTKALLGIMAFGVALHHMAQKTCAPWHPWTYIVHGLDPFVPIGYFVVGVFLFCSGMGLYKSLKTKPDYLKGFFRKRIVPIVIAFYLSEFIYTAARLLMGEKMDALKTLWYLSGLHMANTNAWYVIVIPFFYLAFWAAFRFCRKEGWAIFLLFLFTAGYTVLGACIDHQNDWWMRGEWWYNSIMLFPLGILFARFEKPVTALAKKGYYFWLILSLAAFILLFQQSEWLNNGVWGYYREGAAPMKVPYRLMSAGLQWLVCVAFTAFCFLVMLKVRLGNRALAWLGAMTLPFYLMHGLFVELFGYNFLDLVKSVVYIKSVPLYMAAVLGCSIPATLLFHFIWKKLVGLTQKRNRPEKDGGHGGTPEKAKRKEKRIALGKTLGKKPGVTRALILCGAAAALCLLLLPGKGGNGKTRVMRGMAFTVPEHFTSVYSDARYAAWEYEASDKRPGRLILDEDIRNVNADQYSTVEQVLAECVILTEAELFINPYGVRMVRGFVDYTGTRERRYYVESKGTMVLMCMSENEQFYDKADCEEALLQTANSVRPVS